MTPIAPTSNTLHRHPLRQMIGGLDQRLSRSHGVRTFSDDPACILRCAIVPASHSLHLSDGARITAGAPVIDLHCWNERVPTMPVMGPDLAWAQSVARRLRSSLRLLVGAMRQDPLLDAAQACRAKVNFVGRGGSNISVSRIITRMGFEDVDEGVASPWGRMHDSFENVLIAALVWTHNPGALRRQKMLRERRPVYASRARLLRLYQPETHPLAACATAGVHGAAAPTLANPVSLA